MNITDGYCLKARDMYSWDKTQMTENDYIHVCSNVSLSKYSLIFLLFELSKWLSKVKLR